MDISLLCRSCMKEIESTEVENYNAKVAEMFNFCTKIKILLSSEDNLPKNFCQNCVKNIELCYNFIKEAQNVDIALKNIISRSKTVIVKSESMKDHNHLKLTLPDYKISASINNYKQLCNIDNENVDVKEKSQDDISYAMFEDCTEQEIEYSKEECKETNSVNKYICPVCQKCFTSKLWYSRHIEKEQGRKFTCPYCDKKFLTYSQLSNHTANHTHERRFECNVCGHKFKRRKQLSVHARTHTDIRPYSCDKCEMRFKVKSVLKCHMKVHEDEKPYLCPFCGWSFSQCGNLKVHMRKHTGDKPFKCDKCPFRTSVSSNLRRHEKKHSGAKTHVCHHCRKSFYDATSLGRHKRTHTGELPYKCPCCDRAFVDSWKRKTHLMRTHRMTLQDIPRMTKDGRSLNAES